MQLEKMARIAEENYGENSPNFLQSLHVYLDAQLSYNVGSFSDALANATRLVSLSARVFKEKDNEIQRVPLMELLFGV